MAVREPAPKAEAAASPATTAAPEKPVAAAPILPPTASSPAPALAAATPPAPQAIVALSAEEAEAIAPRRRPSRRDEPAWHAAPSTEPSSTRASRAVSAPEALVQADLEPTLPDVALPERLHVEVADPMGDWAVEVHRHEGSLDLLISGDARLGQVVRDAEQELRRTLAEAGHQVGLLQVASQDAQDRRRSPQEPEPVVTGPRSRTSRKDAPVEGPRRRGGLMVDRVL